MNLANAYRRLEVHVERLLGRRLGLQIKTDDVSVFLLELRIAEYILTLNCLERLVFLWFLRWHLLDGRGVCQDFDRPSRCHLAQKQAG
jgi:hypothetical protein